MVFNHDISEQEDLLESNPNRFLHPEFATNIFDEKHQNEDTGVEQYTMSPEEQRFRINMGIIIFIAGVMIEYYIINYMQ